MRGSVKSETDRFRPKGKLICGRFAGGSSSKKSWDLRMMHRPVAGAAVEATNVNVGRGVANLFEDLDKLGIHATLHKIVKGDTPISHPLADLIDREATTEAPTAESVGNGVDGIDGSSVEVVVIENIERVLVIVRDVVGEIRRSEAKKGSFIR